jgi:hypothetical protein
MAGRITPMITDITMTDKRDWHSDPISSETVIDAAYRNTQNVRRFFKAEIGDHFKFDRPFMAWMKSHQGSTMGDAVTEWLSREARK